jgi:hypothetical protein
MAAPAAPLLLVHCVGCAVAGVDCVYQAVSRVPDVFARAPLIRFQVQPLPRLRRLRRGQKILCQPVCGFFVGFRSKSVANRCFLAPSWPMWPMPSGPAPPMMESK